jgi:alkanesulfonate monooxygenase SsuD/methylene tetrahydromethanopterin reductase-like flavin-dependent oxidoreductase (luciferase family)
MAPHGVSFARPVARMAETVQIVREAMSGGKAPFSGAEFTIPRPGRDAMPMRLSARPEHVMPVYLAAPSPVVLRLTGEIADGWLGTSFVLEGRLGLISGPWMRVWSWRGGLARILMSVRVRRSSSRLTRMRRRRWWRGGRRSRRSASGDGSATTNFL